MRPTFPGCINSATRRRYDCASYYGAPFCSELFPRDARSRTQRRARNLVSMLSRINFSAGYSTRPGAAFSPIEFHRKSVEHGRLISQFPCSYLWPPCFPSLSFPRHRPTPFFLSLPRFSRNPFFFHRPAYTPLGILESVSGPIIFLGREAEGTINFVHPVIA